MKAIVFVRVRALKGVCIGVERNLKPGETAQIESDDATCLALAGQVEILYPRPRDRDYPPQDRE